MDFNDNFWACNRNKFSYKREKRLGKVNESKHGGVVQWLYAGLVIRRNGRFESFPPHPERLVVFTKKLLVIFIVFLLLITNHIYIFADGPYVYYDGVRKFELDVGFFNDRTDTLWNINYQEQIIKGYSDLGYDVYVVRFESSDGSNIYYYPFITKDGLEPYACVYASNGYWYIKAQGLLLDGEFLITKRMASAMDDVWRKTYNGDYYTGRIYSSYLEGKVEIFKLSKGPDAIINVPKHGGIYYGVLPDFSITYYGVNTDFNTFYSTYELIEHDTLIDTGFFGGELWEWSVGETDTFNLIKLGFQPESGKKYDFIVTGYDDSQPGLIIYPEVARVTFVYYELQEGVYFKGVINGRVYQYIPSDMQIAIFTEIGFPYTLWVNDKQIQGVSFEFADLYDIKVVRYAKYGMNEWKVKDSSGKVVASVTFQVLNSVYEDLPDFNILEPSTWIAPFVNMFGKLQSVIFPIQQLFQSAFGFFPSEWILLGSISITLGVLLRLFGR